MKFEDLKKLLHVENKDLLKYLTKKEIVWLDKHFKFINGLLMGRIKTSEKKYLNFIDVIQNKKKPTNEPEIIYKKFINFFENLIKKSNKKNNDPNIIFNGMEINPSGLRPAKNQSVQNVDNRGIFGDNEMGW